MGSFAWERKLGDWRDRADQLYGEQAYSVQEVMARPGRQLVEFPIRELAAQWLAKPESNHGVLLRVVSTGNKKGPIDFFSRESTELASQPTLKLTWADGTRTRLNPVADTFLDCSSLSSLGQRPELKVGGGQTALIRFELPRAKAELKDATLILFTERQYGQGASIGAFRVEPPFERAPKAPQLGLAAKHPRDEGIATDADVVMATGFEETNWRGQWTDYSLRSNVDRLDSDPSLRFEPLQGQALKVTLKKGVNLGVDLRYEFAKRGLPEPDEIYFRYYLRFADDWNPSLDGGKLPGISGTYGKAGWGMRKSDGTNGWSARGGFLGRPTQAVAPTMAGLTALVSYAYHADIDASGDIWPWGLGPGALLTNNRWYAVEQHVKLNTPGQKDGELRAWIDGKLVMHQKGIRYRDVSRLKIETVWIDVYHGGVAPSPHDMSLYIDNVVIARQYIGPMVGAGGR